MKIAVIVEATPHEGQPFDEKDLFQAVQAACLEVLPVDDGWPVVPVVRQTGFVVDEADVETIREALMGGAPHLTKAVQAVLTQTKVAAALSKADLF